LCYVAGSDGDAAAETLTATPAVLLETGIASSFAAKGVLFLPIARCPYRGAALLFGPPFCLQAARRLRQAF
jgi:hypothetical protein